MAACKSGAALFNGLGVRKDQAVWDLQVRRRHAGAYCRQGLTTSSSRQIRALLLPPWLWMLLLSTGASMCATFPRDQAAAAALFTTVPDYVTRYAPLVWLHSEDPFRPSDLFQHVRHTTPMVDGEPLDGLPELDLDNLALLNDRGPDGSPIALTAASGEVTHLPAWLLGETPDETGTLHNATACVVILVEFEGESGDLGAFYFYFYSYNRGANITQVLEPIKGMLEGDVEPGMHFGDHVGDWEHNMIRFRDGKPTGIYFSQHSGGAAYEWDDTALTVEHERPIVYSAYGSHANYASPGDHVHDAVIKDHCDRGLRWDPVSSAYFYSFRPLTSELTRIFPPGSPQEPNFTSAIYFSGLWGDAQYPDSDPRQETVPRFGLKRYVSGPSGPITKQLVRKGLSPDHREPKTWVQWGVSLFMSLYPCCLRGWRVWASGMILICVLVLIVFGIIYAVRRYGARKEGYQKVDTGADIPLNNLDYRDDTIVHGHRSQGDQQ